MKEATGELNMTVVTVVAIAAIGAFFYAFIWPGIKGSIMSSQVCANGPDTNVTLDNGTIYNCGGLNSNNEYQCTDSSSGQTYTCRVKS